MHRFTINKLGPIESIEISEKQFMIFTGPQASGKSTIAKVIYFFRTIKDDILSLIIKKTTNIIDDNETPKDLKNALIVLLRAKFLQVFGSSWGMDNDMCLEYYYDDDTYIAIKLVPDNYSTAPNFIWIDLSLNLRDYLNKYDGILSKYSNSMPENEKNILMNDLNVFFKDEFDVVYIPAGRSIITLLATQLNYMYLTMDDKQKRAIDLCTRNYLENIIKKRPEFEDGLLGLLRNNNLKAQNKRDIINKATDLIEKILKGTYVYNNGDEKLKLDLNHYVKINFASSGQQESVWILNLLFYYLLSDKPMFLIIEEPESNLFPESQKYISELIALVSKAGHNVLVTTHSPYILGSINNLLYASQCPETTHKEIEKIIDRQYWISPESFDAWFLSQGQGKHCVDDELGIIQNELIDDISGVINDDYDRMLSIRLAAKEEAW